MIGIVDLALDGDVPLSGPYVDDGLAVDLP